MIIYLYIDFIKRSTKKATTYKHKIINNGGFLSYLGTCLTERTFNE